MLITRPDIIPGRVFFVEHTSHILQHNPLGDPVTRLHPVWVPPGYETKVANGQRFPLVFELAGFLGSGLGRIAWRAFDESIIERLNRLYHEQKIPDVIVVFPDAFTRLGGNQYINSSAIGQYGDFIHQELLEFIDHTLPTTKNPQDRVIYGKSSGGYGAFMASLLYPNIWGNVGVLAGDCYFDALYRSDWPNTLTTLAKFASTPLTTDSHNRPDSDTEALLKAGIDDGRVSRFLEYMWKNERPNHQETHVLMNICMAATYDPDPTVPNGFRIPFHAYTGELIEERWQQWLKWDPIHCLTHRKDSLRGIRQLYLDCGWSDQYHIHYGMRQLSQALDNHGINHVYKEFSGSHSGIDYRIDNMLSHLLNKTS